MKKIILCVLLASATLMATDTISVYKSGVLLAPDGEAIYKKECIQCHSADGKQTTFEGSSRVVYATINGLDSSSLAKDLKAYRFGSINKHGYGALMKSTLIDLSYEEIDALAEYITENIK